MFSKRMFFFVDFGINSILFQRGIYPVETFKSVENYGLTILMSQDNKIKNFLNNTFDKLKGKTLTPLVHNFCSAQ